MVLRIIRKHSKIRYHTDCTVGFCSYLKGSSLTSDSSCRSTTPRHTSRSTTFLSDLLFIVNLRDWKRSLAKQLRTWLCVPFFEIHRRATHGSCVLHGNFQLECTSASFNISIPSFAARPIINSYLEMILVASSASLRLISLN